MMIDCFAHSLHHRSNLTPAGKGCKAAPRSLFWTLNSLNLLLEMQCEFPFNLMGQTNDNFFAVVNRPTIVHTQLLVCTQGGYPINALNQRFSFICGTAGYTGFPSKPFNRFSTKKENFIPNALVP